jgi:hypothetical protein
MGPVPPSASVGDMVDAESESDRKRNFRSIFSGGLLRRRRSGPKEEEESRYASKHWSRDDTDILSSSHKSSLSESGKDEARKEGNFFRRANSSSDLEEDGWASATRKKLLKRRRGSTARLQPEEVRSVSSYFSHRPCPSRVHVYAPLVHIPRSHRFLARRARTRCLGSYTKGERISWRVPSLLVRSAL